MTAFTAEMLGLVIFSVFLSSAHSFSSSSLFKPLPHFVSFHERGGFRSPKSTLKALSSSHSPFRYQLPKHSQCLFKETNIGTFLDSSRRNFNQRTERSKAGLTILRGIEGTGLFLVGPAAVAVALNSALALLGLITQKYKKVLTLSGLLHAWFLGVVLWTSLGFAGWSSGVLYLVVGSVATKIKQKEKESKGIAGWAGLA